MCGIVGAIDLAGRREFSEQRLLQMTGALQHRGPDDEQVHIEPGLALGVRRLSVIDVAGGRQPIANETGDVWVAFEGELYEYPELRKQLIAQGHQLKTRCDTEAWVHLYEELGHEVFGHARGQFAVALWDRRQRTLLLGRDRVGISPLFYAQQDGWLLWSSEIKGLLASELIEAVPDVKGLDYFFNFFCLPTKRTCFQGIHSLPPAHYLKINADRHELHRYWDLDFPDWGEERRYPNVDAAADELEDLLRQSIRRRLVGEVPLSCYLSGGIDSSVLLAISSQERGEPVPSLTVGLDNSGPSDERGLAAETARLVGSELTTLNVDKSDITDTFPQLISATEGPVMDTSAACLVLLAQVNRSCGQTVALTGEGADEALGGYIWFKWHRLQLLLNQLGWPLRHAVRYPAMSLLIGGGRRHRPAFAGTGGIRTAQQFSWEMMAQSRETLYSAEMWQRLGRHAVYDEIVVPADRMRRWHPLNQSLYAAYKVLLPGLLLSAKGDRAARHGSTEGRYPYLDEHVIDFCAGLATEYKLRGVTDKRLLRLVAKRVLSRSISRRAKTMFRADMGRVFLGPDRPVWVDQLLSAQSLEAAGYFDPQGVHRACQLQLAKPRRSLRRFALDMGLAGVVSTQLWHHLFCGGGLADLPTWSPTQTASKAQKLSIQTYPA